MPKFRIVNIEAVWERASWIVEADDEDHAREVFGEGSVELEWKEIIGNVESMDQEIESVEQIEDDAL